MVPTGNTTKAAQDYYNYLYSFYMTSINTDNTKILLTGPTWIAVFAIILILFFFFYAYYLLHVHRKRGELYGASSFAGAILERIGSVSLFTWLISGLIFAAGIYFIVTQIVRGQIY